MTIILSSYTDYTASVMSQSDHLFEGLSHVISYDLTNKLNYFLTGPKKTVDEPTIALDVDFIDNCVRAFISERFYASVAVEGSFNGCNKVFYSGLLISHGARYHFMETLVNSSMFLYNCLRHKIQISSYLKSRKYPTPPSCQLSDPYTVSIRPFPCPS